MNAPQTYRILIPSTGQIIDMGGSGSLAISRWGCLRDQGLEPELVGPGVELKVSSLLTNDRAECDSDPAK